MPPCSRTLSCLRWGALLPKIYTRPYASIPHDTFVPALRSLLGNNLGDGAETLVAAAREMPQLVTLCGIEPEKEDIDFSGRRLDAGDAKLLAFDLSRNQAVKTMR